MVADAKFCFIEALRRWNVDIDQPLETRFLLNDGHYIGNQFLLGNYTANWVAETNEVQIYCDGQWRLTIPVDVVEEKSTTNNTENVLPFEVPQDITINKQTAPATENNRPKAA